METLGLLFVVKKSKVNARGLVPINLRITINSQRCEISTKIKIKYDQWDNLKQQIKGRTEEARTLNNMLQNFRSNVQQVFIKLQRLDESSINIQKLKKVLKGTDSQSRVLVDIFDEILVYYKNQIGTKYTQKTISRYETCLVRLKSFLKQDIVSEDVHLDELDYKFIKRFDIYLSTNFNCQHNAVMKYLKILKTVIHQAMAFGYINHDPFLGYKTAYKETNRGYLTQKELNTLSETYFDIKRLEVVRNIYLFACYTGISFGDLKDLTSQHIQKSIEGKNVIVLERNKTKVRAVIPILKQAQVIIDKYANHPKCIAHNRLLPVMSNQKYNSYLKEIADICKISKNLSSHLARHTFATTVTLSNGVPIETVQKMLGHTSLKTTQIYAKVIDTKVAEDMRKLEEKMRRTG